MSGVNGADIARIIGDAAQRDPALRQRIEDAGLDPASVTEAQEIGRAHV